MKTREPPQTQVAPVEASTEAAVEQVETRISQRDASISSSPPQPPADPASLQHTLQHPTSLTPQIVLKLQRSCGNRFVQRHLVNCVQRTPSTLHERIESGTPRATTSAVGEYCYCESGEMEQSDPRYPVCVEFDPDALRRPDSHFVQWLSFNRDGIVTAVRTDVESRLTRLASSGLPSSMSGESGDPDWVRNVNEQLTGLSYASAHSRHGGPAGSSHRFGGPDEWRSEYRSSGDYPTIAVCDQMGELIQHIRGLQGYGGGLMQHYQFYLRQRAILPATPANIQPGASIFNVQPYSGSGLLSDYPDRPNRVPRESWTAAQDRDFTGRLRQLTDRRRTAQGEGGEGGEGQDDQLAQDIEQLQTDMNQIYERRQKITHENVILRTRTHRGAVQIQLFDFTGHVSQEEGQWRHAGSYIGSDRRLGYVPTGTVRRLGNPRGSGYIRMLEEGNEVGRIDIPQGQLSPPSHYMAAMAAAPYRDMIALELILVSESGEELTRITQGGDMSRLVTP